jgi:hypothetical protein
MNNISTENLIKASKIYDFSSINHRHPYYETAKNNTLDWFGYDNYDTFEKNKKTNFDELKKYGWLNKKVIYKFNSDGFRGEEFTIRGGIAFFGCSFTMGEGVPVENTWPYLVANHLKLPYYNFGISGLSGDACVRFAAHYLPELKPSIVVFLYPPDDRFEYIKDEFSYQMMSSMVIANRMEDFEAEYYKRWASSDTNRFLTRFKNLLTMKKLSEIINAKFIFRDQNEFKHIDSARDLAHQGILSHQVFADQIVDDINKNEERLI